MTSPIVRDFATLAAIAVGLGAFWLLLTAGLLGLVCLAIGSILILNAGALRLLPKRASRWLGWSPLQFLLCGLALIGFGVVTMFLVWGAARLAVAIASVLCIFAVFGVGYRERRWPRMPL